MRKLALLLVSLAAVRIACVACAADAPDHTLGLTCTASENRAPLAPNAPIWLDVKLTNNSNTGFVGQYSSAQDYGAFAMVSKASRATIDNEVYRASEGLFWVPFTIGIGGNKVFRVLLSNSLHVASSGRLSACVYLPLRASDGKWFTLVAPLNIVIGDPLPKERLKELSDRILDSVESAVFAERLEAVQSTKVLPDEYALPILAHALNSGGLGPVVVDLLGSRMRTSANREILSEAATSPNAYVSSRAKQYLSK